MGFPAIWYRGAMLSGAGAPAKHVRQKRNAHKKNHPPRTRPSILPTRPHPPPPPKKPPSEISNFKSEISPPIPANPRHSQAHNAPPLITRKTPSCRIPAAVPTLFAQGWYFSKIPHPHPVQSPHNPNPPPLPPHLQTQTPLDLPQKTSTIPSTHPPLHHPPTHASRPLISQEPSCEP